MNKVHAYRSMARARHDSSAFHTAVNCFRMDRVSCPGHFPHILGGIILCIFFCKSGLVSKKDLLPLVFMGDARMFPSFTYQFALAMLITYSSVVPFPPLPRMTAPGSTLSIDGHSRLLSCQCIPVVFAYFFPTERRGVGDNYTIVGINFNDFRDL